MNPKYEELTLREFLTELNSLIHEPVRLGILTLLLFHDRLPFSIIQNILGVTSGNLNSHTKKLTEEGLVTITKTFVDARPRTVIKITPKGRNSLRSYSKQVVLLLQEVFEEIHLSEDENKQQIV
ncbi:MAG: transcriptional regulator [Promethearchaeota archaeon]